MTEGIAFCWLVDLIFEHSPNQDQVLANTLKLSLDYWAAIDGHVLLYAFLPALLFGDAMGLNGETMRGLRIAMIWSPVRNTGPFPVLSS